MFPVGDITETCRDLKDLSPLPTGSVLGHPEENPDWPKREELSVVPPGNMRYPAPRSTGNLRRFSKGLRQHLRKEALRS